MRSRLVVEVRLHWLAVTVLPSAIAVARVSVGHVGVVQRHPRAARNRLQQHLDLRVRIDLAEFGCSPRLDDPAAGFQLQVSPVM